MGNSMKLEFAENRPFDVIALGRVGVDMYANDVNCPMEEIRSFSPYIGGSPANIAMGTAKLGLKTGFIGRIAPDGFGRFIISKFQKAGIDTAGLVYDNSGANTQIAVSEILSPERPISYSIGTMQPICIWSRRTSGRIISRRLGS